MTNHLEERARSARRAVEDSTAAIDPGTFATRSRAAGAVIVAVMLGAIGLGAWWVAGDGTDGVETVNVADDEQSSDDADQADQDASPTTAVPTTTVPTTVQTPIGEVEYLVLDPAPSGEVLILSDDADNKPPNALYNVYGRADADNPFADGDLTVVMVSADDAEQVTTGNEPAGEAVTIGDTTAYYESESPLVMSWIRDDGALFGLLSSSLTREEMAAVATSIIVDDKIDPAGLDLLAENVSSGINGASMADIGQAVLYGEDDETAIVDDAFLVAVELAAAPTPADEILSAALYGLGDRDSPAAAWEARSRRIIEFGGQEVLVISRAPSTTLLAFDTAWGPARITTISSTESENGSVGLDETLALIPNLRPATEAEVVALLEAGKSLDDARTATTIDQGGASGPDLVIEGTALINGTRSDGSRWAVSLVDTGGEARICSFDGAIEAEATCVTTASEASIDGTRWITTNEPGVAVTVLQLDGIADVDGIELVDGDTSLELEFIDGPAGPTWYIVPVDPFSGPALLRVRMGDSPPRDLALPDGAIPAAGGSMQPTIVVMAKP